ncbi:MAG TPA: cytochrome c-type biogenesis protein [Rhizomicrobium sp.]|jgi:cytochrome c-type biogenesis protein CcmH|nr:cytochrome c-type biogenesis protein [Rhizomicrobium sp.]HXL71332.1 cytochrome c-type biogenesis protein [Rhizomicrobium sp.]
MKRLIFSFLLAASLGSAALAAPVAGTFSSQAMETRARALQRQLRCLVCQGESIDESQAPLAAELRQLVREQMADGRTDSQIKQFLVARYGDFILMEPPLQPDTYFLWLAPFVVLLGAGGVAYWVIRRSKPADSASP